MATIGTCILLYMLVKYLGADTCSKSHFHEVVKIKHKGIVLQTLPSVAMEMCKRTCRLYKECYHFNMMWLNDGTPRGNCHLLQMGAANLTSHASTSYFVSGMCGSGMVPLPPTGNCYLVITDPLNHAEATSRCSGIHPKAHLVDILSIEEQISIGTLVEAMAPTATGIYTAGKNTASGSTGYNMKWMNTGAGFTFTLWLPGQPYRGTLDSICVVLFKTTNPLWLWNDVPCNGRTDLVSVCELDQH